jgi:light-regulated signal transduction histidine kinase (bacteriophytochrome)
MIGAKLEEYIVQSATIQYFIFSIVLSLAIIGKVLIENKSNHKLLKLQNSKMQTQNEELMRFNYIISHDLKEPIRSIVGLTGLLAKKTNGENSDISSEIVTLGTRLNNMVNDIVKFQEIDKISQNIESFSLSEIIENIKSNISKTLTKSDAVITHHGVDQISGLKTCVYLILKNLIENSIKYNNKKPVITIQCSTENCHYSITVTDNGIGIPDIYQDEVFVMFKRLNQIKSEKGSGLGLSISKKIAQKDGATLEILKSGNEGTTFILKKPLSDNLS